MDIIKSAELLAKQKHSGQLRKDGVTTYSKHLEDVVGRLKSLGVVDEAILCAGWLHDTIEILKLVLRIYFVNLKVKLQF